jgi:hypothetical protein
MSSSLTHHPYGNGIDPFTVKHSKQSSIGQASPGGQREEDSSLILNLNLRFFDGV